MKLEPMDEASLDEAANEGTMLSMGSVVRGMADALREYNEKIKDAPTKTANIWAGEKYTPTRRGLAMSLRSAAQDLIAVIEYGEKI